MTREENIKGLKLLEDNITQFDELQNNKGEWIDVHELLFETISALEQEQKDDELAAEVVENALKIKDEPCDDAISREAVLSVIDGWYEQNRDTENIEDLIILITYMSSVQPSRKGHWIEVEKYSDGKHKIECSECGNYIFDRGHANSQNVKEKYRYCNYCGADMREGDNE